MARCGRGDGASTVAFALPSTWQLLEAAARPRNGGKLLSSFAACAAAYRRRRAAAGSQRHHVGAAGPGNAGVARQAAAAARGRGGGAGAGGAARAPDRRPGLSGARRAAAAVPPSGPCCASATAPGTGRRHSGRGDAGAHARRCRGCPPQVAGCHVDLTHCKPYSIKKRACVAHMQADWVCLSATDPTPWRFCQQVRCTCRWGHDPKCMPAWGLLACAPVADTSRNARPRAFAVRTL